MGDDWEEPTQVDSPRTAELLLPVNRAQLVVLVGEGAGRVHDIRDDVVIIGRGTTASVLVTASDVSREHARIVRTGPGEYTLEDLKSRNGTRVNGVPITRHTLRFGDKIQVGTAAVFVFTHYDQMDEQLMQLQKLDSVGQLASGMAHDFGNLLHAIVGNLDFLERHTRTHYGDDDEMMQAVTETKQAAARGTDLTGRLLAIARHQGGEMEDVRLVDLVQEVIGLIRRTIPKTIQLEVAVDPTMVVRGDRGGLHQVLMNICLNARDAMPDGGRLKIEGHRVTIGPQDMLARPFLPIGSYALLRISDTGIGMNDATRRRMFEPFFSTKGAQGTGLGLASAYSIVRNHGGRILVRSELGEGAIFDVHLPARDTTSDSRSTGSYQKVPGIAGSPARQTGRHMVLLLDSDASMCKATRRMLSDLGYEVLCAQGDMEAIEFYQARHRDIAVVLMDVSVENLNSAQTINVLRKVDPHVQILLTCDSEHEDSARALMQTGARGFLRKPFQATTLERALAGALLG